MGMNREKLLKAYPSMPEAVGKRMEDTMLKLRMEASMQPACHMASKRKHAFLLAMAVLLLAAAVGAAAGLHFGVFDFMAGLFGQAGVLPQARELLETDLAFRALEHSAVAVEEALYDGGHLRVVYSVCSADESLSIEEAAQADQVSLYGCDWFYLNGERIGMTNGSSFGSVLAPEDDRLLCYLDICLTSSNIVPEGDFIVGLPLIGNEPLFFPISSHGVPSSPVGTETSAVRATLLSASLSPVRAYARLRIEKQPGASDESYKAALDDWRDAYLVDAQGNKLSTPAEILTDACAEGEWIELTYVFLPVEAEEVFFAPTVITPENEWVVDIAHALPMQ